MREGTVDIKLRYVHRDVDRHGNVRFYFRRCKGAPKLRMPPDPRSAEFHQRYQELLQGERPAAPRAPLVNTFRWLVVQYLASAAYKRLGKGTQAIRRQMLEAMTLEPIRPDSHDTFANMPLAALNLKALKVLRDRKLSLPAAAFNRVKILRALFRWAMAEELVRLNPARDLELPRFVTTGFHTWSVDEVRAFQARHPMGTKARLGLSLLLWTGVRRSDVVQLGRQHARGGWLKFTQAKNKHVRPIQTEIPILPELQRVLDASPVGDLTYLVTETGRPFTPNSFGRWFRARCDEAGLGECSAHGLRKAGAATAAENGASTKQLMAIFGWLSMAEAERYTRAAERKRMAGDAMGLLVNKSSPPK